MGKINVHVNVGVAQTPVFFRNSVGNLKEKDWLLVFGHFVALLRGLKMAIQPVRILIIFPHQDEQFSTFLNVQECQPRSTLFCITGEHFPMKLKEGRLLEP